MNDDPSQGAPQDAGPDPLEDTQRVDVPRYAPTPDPRPDARWAWAAPASPAGQPTSERWYEPAPAEGPPAYTTPAFGPPSSMPPGSPANAYVQAPAAAQTKRRGGAGVGTVVVASVLSAVLASGSTVLVLERTGAFDRQAPSSSIGTAQPVAGQQPVTINESSAVIDAADRVGPAVVKITTQGSGSDPFTQIPSSGVGSGFIYDAKGWILTNRHVVADAEKLSVELKDGRVFEGTVYGIDTLTDLAVVKIEATDLPVAPIGRSDGLKIGQLVVAIGSPLGMYSFSVTSGIVSGKGRDIAVDNGTRINNLIQTDAAINPGNSGGPLADASGSVVGINTAVATDSSGIGFAIPIDIAKPIMAQAVAGEALSRPWIGIRFQSINLQVKKDLGLSVDAGALVTNTGGTGPAVVEGSPAAAAGIQDGDIIISISGIKIDGEHPLDAILTQFMPEDTVSLDVLRDGTTVTLDVTLGTRPGNL
ncbi:MAG TPA: trypsin-like peptidase domain-containing protein [Candidatus Limnocylindrales bacterium]|nr:trypsin-like peptidase domain-containing protein [Candidatus Limnocylindrales bacterium]